MASRKYYKKVHISDGKAFQNLLEVVENEAYACWLIRPFLSSRQILIFREFPDYGYDLESGRVHCSLSTTELCNNTSDDEILRPKITKKILKTAKLEIKNFAERRMQSNQIELSERRSKATEGDILERNCRYWTILDRAILAGKVAEILKKERVWLAQDWIMATADYSFVSACVVNENPEFVEHQTVSYIWPEPAFAHPIEKDRRVIPVAWKTHRDIPDNSLLETWVAEDGNFIPFLKKAISRLKE